MRTNNNQRKVPKVYLIDDDPVVTYLLVDLVDSVNLPHVVFDSAVKFLEQDLSGLEGCIVTDLRMPGMSGLELCLKVKGCAASALTILMTAYPDATTERHARRSGIDGYLAKPCDPEALLACLGPKLAGQLPDGSCRRYPILGQGLTDTSG